MENIYLILVVILFFLAASDLVVGVSNDAVNFLNSAIGSKAASFRTILFIASIGIFVGATFSTGMMEVARKGIFNPQHFYFGEIMIIFLAVMITDVILLDAFNSLGLPTSTTVSLVFELMGAAVAVSLFKLADIDGQQIMVDGVKRVATLGDYINSAKSLAIITGILSSVVIAFTVGAIIQFFVRLVFSFKYDVKLKYLGSVWGGVAITSIIYFLLIKGASHAVFMGPETKAFIKGNANQIMIYSFVLWTIVLQISKLLFKVDILKFVVLMGTFALAMAFAGNDLVNFIGVPIAGFSSYEVFASPQNSLGADELLMTALAEKTFVPSYMLVIAGLIMVLTLWFSKKAKNVTKTELSLSRQQEGEERFGSSFLARSIVRGALKASESVSKVMPLSVSGFIARQFDSTQYEEKRKKLGNDAPNFDLIRASVNLVVSSILISIATSYKLPLSTTYVTFMVAMGTSLSDRSWGRESAVYRITGVLSVIGGWFFTAFSAFTAAFIFASLIKWIGIWAIFILVVMAVYFVYHTHVLYKRKTAEEIKLGDIEIDEIDGELLPGTVLKRCKISVNKALFNISEAYIQSVVAFESEDRKALKQVVKDVKELNQKTKKLRYNIYSTVKKLQEESIDSSLYYVQVIDYLRESAHCLSFIVNPMYEHLDNNHKVFSKDQFVDLVSLQARVNGFMKDSIKTIELGDFSSLDSLLSTKQSLLEHLRLMRKIQLKRIKKEKAGTKVSLLYLNLLHESQNMLLHIGNLLKAQRDFVKYQK
ncbi:MAG: inorganic phosphate transporter [Marinilabiliaceae bacterium]|nr:inorganic phosphate transporter [Marinilabiliaceae bacterium]